MLNRLGMALAAFAVLMVLAWQTLSDERIRLVTLAILALLAFKTLLHARRVQREREQADGSK